ncbi:hypothetical protein CASFOL_006954 [Castilleja foliolosa]|uniref:Succinate dehydrogenase assembly factor 4, mitochondrial n=1 Tax=Castilleja foliolosa TaxID=1961234 RepID=A0ABD3E8S9_9LAMI
MASNLYRLLSSPIARSELSGSPRLICSTAQLLQNQLPETKESPINEVKEKIHNQIEDEKKQPQPSEDEEIDESVNKVTGEYGGPRGPEPTRYGDWEKNGRCSDF